MWAESSGRGIGGLHRTARFQESSRRSSTRVSVVCICVDLNADDLARRLFCELLGACCSVHSGIGGIRKESWRPRSPIVPPFLAPSPSPESLARSWRPVQGVHGTDSDRRFLHRCKLRGRALKFVFAFGPPLYAISGDLLPLEFARCLAGPARWPCVRPSEDSRLFAAKPRVRTSETLPGRVTLNRLLRDQDQKPQAPPRSAPPFPPLVKTPLRSLAKRHPVGVAPDTC